MNHWISQLSVTMVPQDLVEPLNKLSSSGADSMRSALSFFFFLWSVVSTLVVSRDDQLELEQAEQVAGEPP